MSDSNLTFDVNPPVSSLHSTPWGQDIRHSTSSGAPKLMASDAARVLGSIKTEKKSAAARENGKKGGRPRIHPTQKNDKPQGPAVSHNQSSI